MEDGMGSEVTNPTGFNALSPQQRLAHRVKVGVRAEAILSQFWREDEPDAVRAMVLESWMDVLESASHDEIREAWTDYQRNGPRSANGRLARPDPGALWHRIRGRRPKLHLVQPELPRVVISEEERSRRAAVLSDLAMELRKKAQGAGLGGREA